MMGLNYYKRLIRHFLEGKLAAEEFQKAYLTAFKQEKGGMNPILFAILQDLFEDADAYSPLWSEAEESAIRLTEQSLRREATDALEQLEIYQQK